MLRDEPVSWNELRLLTPRERVTRDCGRMHTGVCDVERQRRWSQPGAWIPPEYREEVTTVP